VPCGFFDGLPVGLQIASAPGREDLVLRVAEAFQQAFPRPERPVIS
jgi:amidase/aspartyl-tRNA(Asn)/glutamyl-tRNA(Gln) amidotransferase subunit A